MSLLSLVDRCVLMGVCKHGCDVLDLLVALRIILKKAIVRALFLCLHSLI